jgi:NAD(P)-dependent dehydrogenase (short-subunit alcohol dehydrogenase family)
LRIESTLIEANIVFTQKLEKLGLSSSSLAGKVVLITGSGQGIGKELALAASRLGARVIIAEIGDSGKGVEELIRAEGGTAIFLKADVSKEDSVKELAKKAFEAFGKVDVVVNNAAIEFNGSVLEQPLSAWERAYAVNTLGPLLMIKAFLPAMLERKDGSIINVLSSEGMPYLAPYSASKSALQSLGTSLITELGEDTGVSIFNFAPGMVDTPGANTHIRMVAPRLGMTFEQFTHMGVNPGYEGLMPAEDCAAGFAYVIAHAKDYHGQTADAFLPLMRAGASGGSHAAPQAAQTQASPASAVEACIEVRKVIEAVNKEVEELDIFRKTWMRNDFNKKAGMSIKDWLKTSEELEAELSRMAGDKNGPAELKKKLPLIISKSEKLAGYFKSTAETAMQYFKDPKERDIAIGAIEQRERAVRSMIKALKEIS